MQANQIFTEAQCAKTRAVAQAMPYVGVRTKFQTLGYVLDNWPVDVPRIDNRQALIDILNEVIPECGWCGGRGHKTDKCSTPIYLREKAKFRGCSWNLGALKGCCWDPNEGAEVV